MIAEQTKLRENERVRTKINLRNNWAFEQKTKHTLKTIKLNWLKTFIFGLIESTEFYEQKIKLQANIIEAYT